MEVIKVIGAIIAIILAIMFTTGADLPKLGGNEGLYMATMKAKRLNELINEYKNNYELHNIVERYIVTNYNTSRNFFFGDSASIEKLKGELADKGFPESFYDKMQIIIEANLADDGPNMAPIVTIEANRAYISYGEFTFDIPKYRYELLKSMGDDMEIARAAMRYYCLLPGGQQWAIALEDYEEYVKEAKMWLSRANNGQSGPNVANSGQLGPNETKSGQIDTNMIIEGFSGPFNSQIIRLGPYSFCSLFEEDKVFGGLGSFFDQDFSGKFVIVNPPYVESLLIQAAVKILEQLDKGNCKFIFVGPYWADSQFVALLGQSKYLVGQIVKQKGQRWFEDLYSGKKIKAIFNVVNYHLES
jgi:Phosphorylated CTD interacting factor 1 WW domain